MFNGLPVDDNVVIVAYDIPRERFLIVGHLRLGGLLHRYEWRQAA